MAWSKDSVDETRMSIDFARPPWWKIQVRTIHDDTCSVLLAAAQLLQRALWMAPPVQLPFRLLSSGQVQVLLPCAGSVSQLSRARRFRKPMGQLGDLGVAVPKRRIVQVRRCSGLLRVRYGFSRDAESCIAAGGTCPLLSTASLVFSSFQWFNIRYFLWGRILFVLISLGS